MGRGGLRSIAMTPTQDNISVKDFYAPGTAVASEEPGRIERFLNAIYRVHRFRGGVTFRAE